MNMNRERMVSLFKEMVAISSVSGNEGPIQNFLIDQFQTLGLDVYQDNSQIATQLGANNIVAKWRGNVEGTPIFFSCHVDTVSPGEGIEVVEREEILYSKEETILAADNKAGIAIMLEMMHLIKENNIATPNIEFVLSTGEEIGLIGAEELDMSLIDAEIGYVLDNAGPVGSAIVASPSLYMFEIEIIGKAAHAGLEPENGISTLEVATKALNQLTFGRIDHETTSNIGVISGGVSSNIVMEKLLLKGEVRSISQEKADKLVKNIQDVFETTSQSLGAICHINVEKKATGFRLEDNAEVLQLARLGMKDIGITLQYEVSGGGSDANVFNAKGKSVTNLSIGYEKIHTVDEYIPIPEMEKSVAFGLAVLKQAKK